MKKKWLMLLSVLVLGGLLVAQAVAVTVNVTLPDFTVTLNDQVVDNSHRQYPLLVYQGVTYFPMTYDDCRFLGVETQWTDQDGLDVQKTSVSVLAKEASAKKVNKITQRAKIADFPITIGAEIIEGNSQYPFLMFRNVTYIPMTWRYCTELLGWQMNFDAQKGLTVASDNPRIHQIAIKDAGYHFMLMGDQIVTQVGREIISLPLAESGVPRRTLITIPNDHQMAQFASMNGEYYMLVNDRGNVDDINEQYRLLADGTMEQVPRQGYSRFGDVVVMIEEGDYETTGNLSVQKDGGAKRLIGDKQYHYQVLGSMADSSLDGVYFIDQDHIVLRARAPKISGDDSLLCHVDLISGKTTMLAKQAGSWDIDGQMLYYRWFSPERDQGDIYQVQMPDGEVVRIETPQPYAGHNGQFKAMGGKLYYQNNAWSPRPLIAGAVEKSYHKKIEERWQRLLIGDYELYAWDAPNHGAEVVPLNSGSEMAYLDKQGDYIYGLFSPKEVRLSEPYRLMVFDKKGQVVFKTIDEVERVVIDNDRMLYRLRDDEALYWVDLAH